MEGTFTTVYAFDNKTMFMPAFIPALTRIILWLTTNPYGKVLAVEGATRAAVPTTRRLARDWQGKSLTESLQTYPPRTQLSKPHSDLTHTEQKGSEVASRSLWESSRGRSSGALVSQEQQAVKDRIRRRVLVVATLIQLVVAWPFDNPWGSTDVPPPYDQMVYSEWLSLRNVVPPIRTVHSPTSGSGRSGNPIEICWTEFRSVNDGVGISTRGMQVLLDTATHLEEVFIKERPVI